MTLEPIGTIVRKRVPFEECCVESIRVVNEFLEDTQRNFGSERRTPQVLQEAIETAPPKTYDDVVFLGNTAERVWNARY
jgi:hypothetical protein